VKQIRFLLPVLLFVGIATSQSAAQAPCSDMVMPTGFVYPGSACSSSQPFGSVTPTPLVDGATNLFYGNTGQIVSLYGTYGVTDERQTNSPLALTHYSQGITLAGQIQPLCSNGVAPGSSGCTDQKPPKIVFLFIGFSNCDLEICGGHVDAWDAIRANPGPGQVPLPQLAGQACATKCPNVGNPEAGPAYNEASRYGVSDGYDQLSFLRLVYPPTGPSLVGPSVVVFNGALGGQTLEKWDPTPIGYYESNPCDYDRFNQMDPECNFYRVADDLRTNGFTEAQVQAIFIKSGDNFPSCDLQHNFCPTSTTPDAYQAEIYLGDILRYLKCCKLNPDGTSSGITRYPNLKQVFLASRTYGGYANATSNGNTCLNPEPFAYELGFAIQNAVVAQITTPSDPAPYLGAVDYKSDGTGHAPWFDWGPYLWAYGETARQFDGLRWCNGQTDAFCNQEHDVNYGDPNDQTDYWGDFTHPAGSGVMRVANQLVTFIQSSPWVTPWINY
jgi:hypothetical protein